MGSDVGHHGIQQERLDAVGGKSMKPICLLLGLVFSLAAHANNDAQQLDKAAEATRAFRQAMSTLSSLTAVPTPDPSITSVSTNPWLSSIFSSVIPNLQGQGPVATVYRIAVKLQHYTLRRLSNSKEGLGLGSRRKDDELRGKAIKVIDLLQHSAELGNSDALFTLAKISLVRPTWQCCGRN
jgi:SEL1 protein